MRDLKHLLYFENLLTEANNELVKKRFKKTANLHSDTLAITYPKCCSISTTA